MEIWYFLARQALIGFAAAACFIALLLMFDIGNIATMMFRDDLGLFFLFLMFLVIGSTFASVQAGIALMTGKFPPKDHQD